MEKKFTVVKNFKIVKRSCSLNRYYRVSKDKKRGMPKKYQRSGWNFFQKIVKRTGSNNCEQGGKKPQNS